MILKALYAKARAGEITHFTGIDTHISGPRTQTYGLRRIAA